MVHLLAHPLHPPLSSLASLKNMGSEPFFTLAHHASAHTHTHIYSAETHTLGDAIVHSAGVSASVPSTPWTIAWHHPVLSIIKGGKQFRGNSGQHSLRSPWGKHRDGSLISSELWYTVERLTDIGHIYTVCVHVSVFVWVFPVHAMSSNNSEVFPSVISCCSSIWVAHVPFL